MAGTGHFQSNIGDDGVKRWKYIGPPIEIVEIPFVGGVFNEHTYRVGRCFLTDDYILRLDFSNDGYIYIYGYDFYKPSNYYFDEKIVPL